MARNDKDEITADVTPTAVGPLVITWTANEPTAALTQTVADGTVPTVAELGQALQNVNTILSQAVADLAALSTSVNS